MSSQCFKILLTGLPGCGKTTAIIQIVKNLKKLKAAGFYTQEIRKDNVRKGFRWTLLDGRSGILAHVDIKGQPRVGKYGVDIASFENSVVGILNPAQTDVNFFVIDEIGKMECLSKKFITAIHQLFSSDRTVLATVAYTGSGLISEVKDYPATKLFCLTRENRNRIVAEVLQDLQI
jgi:nucleoside-triphosphatase